MENQTTEIPEKVIGQVISQYKTFGVGYDKHDPELQVAIRKLGEITEFLSTRCVGDQGTISLMHKVVAIAQELQTFRKMIEGGKVYKSEYHPLGIFEKGYDYSWRELQAMGKYPISFKKQYDY